MVGAAWIACELGFLKREEVERHEEILSRVGLPTKLSEFSESQVIDQMQWDKKWVSEKSRFVLLEKIGSPILYSDVPVSVIKKALRRLSLERRGE